MDSLGNEEEKFTFHRIVSAFKSYKNDSLCKIIKNERYVSTLPIKHQRMLRSYLSHLKQARSCIEQNYKVIQLIIKDIGSLFVNVSPEQTIPSILAAVAVDELDLDKVQSTLKQLVRDWSAEGVEERNTCYQPIIDEILYQFPKHLYKSPTVKVLIPGAGLGRLVFEISRLGYMCQGNEFSLFMLIASNFVINRCRGLNLYKLYPWVHQYDNNLMSIDQLACVYFPDVDTSDCIPGDSFSMVVGDFTEVYQKENEWDCIATCFFIDCANNILTFIETIFKILKPGGIWINLGPLLYHFSNIADQNSIEPSYEMIREIIMEFGFIYEKEKTKVKSKYAQNPKSMLQYEYESVYFVCRKPSGYPSASSTNGDGSGMTNRVENEIDECGGGLDNADNSNNSGSNLGVGSVIDEDGEYRNGNSSHASSCNA